jgi:hypothetical protein
MKQTERIQQVLSWLSESKEDNGIITLTLPKGFKKAVETINKNKMFFTCEHFFGTTWKFKKIKELN